MTREMPGWWWALIALGGVKALAGLPGYAFRPLPAGPDSPFPTWLYLTTLLVYATIGATLLLGGRRDRRAMLLGGVFVLAASLAADRPLARLDAHTSSWIVQAGAVLGALDPGAFRPMLVWMFARSFPRDALTGRWRQFASAGQFVCAGVGVTLFAISIWLAVDVATGGSTLPRPLARFTSGDPAALYLHFLTPLTLAGVPLAVQNMRAAGRSDQRRAQLFITGLVVGTAPILAEAAAEALIPPYGRFMSQPTPRFWSGVVFYPLLYGGLAVAAYAVYMNQALSVRLFVRKAVRYAFARATLWSLLLVPFGLLSWLAYEHRAEPIGALLSGPRQLALLALAAALAVLLRVRRRLLTALDRRFFREQYDARHILASLIDSGRSAASLETLAEHLAAEIDRALHVTRVQLYVADAGQHALRPVVGSGDILACASTLATLLKGSDAPLDLAGAPEDHALSRLPPADREWVARGGFALLVPINDGHGALTGLLALGEKKSELPYSREDRWLLGSTASSAALAIERLQTRSSGHGTPGGEVSPPHDHQEAARECARCGTVCARTQTTCPDCGETLGMAAVPLTLRGLRVDRRIGSGGMGVVYRATDTSLRRQVAVKTLPAVSMGQARQLRREARAMAALSHPNLATIHAVDAWRGTPLLIVEYLQGGTLQDWLRAGPLDIGRVLQAGVDLAGALDHMHAQSTLHRDIKPSNIGFTSTGIPKLLDFGLARFVDVRASRNSGGAETTTSTSEARLTPSALLIGTPAYFSPELVALQPPDFASDLWALALSLYEAISGQNPMAGGTTVETLQRIATLAFPRLDTLRADCPSNIADGFARALSRDPRERPASARELRALLAGMG